jgi:hypothetical protein
MRLRVLRNLEGMARQKTQQSEGGAGDRASAVVGLPLWQLDIVELRGHNIESRGRDEVNHLLNQGWRLLQIYTLKYQEDGVWRERPMAILGKPRTKDESQKDV